MISRAWGNLVIIMNTVRVSLKKLLPFVMTRLVKDHSVEIEHH